MMPNPLDDRYTSYAGLDELMKYLIYQRAPDVLPISPCSVFASSTDGNSFYL